MKEFVGKVAVITGAASGIGLGLAERCAQEGMTVVLADIEEGALAKAEEAIKAMGARTLAVVTDVSRASDVENLARKTVEAFGAVHLLFNNAGVGVSPTVWESTLQDWKWVLGVNLWGVIHGVHYFVPVMLKQGTECYVVNTASLAGLTTSTNNGPYAVSKHGVVALSETLYRELQKGGHKIGVSVVCPGFIKSNIALAERNRPAEFRNKPVEGADPSGISSAHSMIQRIGMPREKAADIIFDAIRRNKFYVIPSGEFFRPQIRGRMKDIVKERNPMTIPVNLKKLGV